MSLIARLQASCFFRMLLFVDLTQFLAWICLSLSQSGLAVEFLAEQNHTDEVRNTKRRSRKGQRSKKSAAVWGAPGATPREGFRVKHFSPSFSKNQKKVLLTFLGSSPFLVGKPKTKKKQKRSDLIGLAH